jgi:hypothetical protein
MEAGPPEVLYNFTGGDDGDAPWSGRDLQRFRKASTAQRLGAEGLVSYLSSSHHHAKPRSGPKASVTTPGGVEGRCHSADWYSQIRLCLCGTTTEAKPPTALDRDIPQASFVCTPGQPTPAP